MTPAAFADITPLQASEAIGAAYCSCRVDSQTILGQISYSNFAVNGYGTASASAFSDPSNGLTLYASATGNTEAEAQIIYFFEIQGPSNTNVPVDVSGLLQASMSGPIIFNGPNSYAALTIYGPGAIEKLQEEATAGAGYSQKPTDSFDDTVSLPANQLIQVELTAVSAASTITTGFASTYTGMASIDPYIQIAPSFAAANPGYSLEFSPGVYNAPAAAPEPAAYVPLAAGLLAIASCVRRRILA